MNRPGDLLCTVPSAAPLDVDPVSGRLLSVAELQRFVHGSAPLHVPRPSGALCISVHAAQPGAGASTVALTTAVSAQRPVHLIEWCAPDRSTLAGASTRELGRIGLDGWQRGLRGQVVIDRPGSVGGRPCRDTAPDVAFRIDDRGLDTSSVGDVVIVVCRATVPGLRQLEVALARMDDQVNAVAAVGPARWSGLVRSSVGPRLRVLRQRGRVVTVPLDRRLVVAGLSGAALPRTVLQAGRQLIGIVETDAPGLTRHASARTS